MLSKEVIGAEKHVDWGQKLVKSFERLCHSAALKLGYEIYSPFGSVMKSILSLRAMLYVLQIKWVSFCDSLVGHTLDYRAIQQCLFCLQLL